MDAGEFDFPFEDESGGDGGGEADGAGHGAVAVGDAGVDHGGGDFFFFIGVFGDKFVVLDEQVRFARGIDEFFIEHVSEHIEGGGGFEGDFLLIEESEPFEFFQGDGIFVNAQEGGEVLGKILAVAFNQLSHNVTEGKVGKIKGKFGIEQAEFFEVVP